MRVLHEEQEVLFKFPLLKFDEPFLQLERGGKFACA